MCALFIVALQRWSCTTCSLYFHLERDLSLHQTHYDPFIASMESTQIKPESLFDVDNIVVSLGQVVSENEKKQQPCCCLDAFIYCILVLGLSSTFGL